MSSIIQKLPFELKQLVFEFALPQFLFDAIEIAKTKKVSITNVGMFEIIHTNVDIGNNDIETYDNIVKYFEETYLSIHTNARFQHATNVADDIGLVFVENENELFSQTETLFHELPLVKNMMQNRVYINNGRINNVSVVNTNNTLYTQHALYNGGYDVYCEIENYIIDDIHVSILHTILLNLNLYDLLDDDFKTDNTFVYDFMNRIMNLESNYIKKIHIDVHDYIHHAETQLCQLSEKQRLSIYNYYNKHY